MSTVAETQVPNLTPATHSRLIAVESADLAEAPLTHAERDEAL